MYGCFVPGRWSLQGANAILENPHFWGENIGPIDRLSRVTLGPD